MVDLGDLGLFVSKNWKYPMCKIIIAGVMILFPGLLGNIGVNIPNDRWSLRIVFVAGALIIAFFGIKDLEIQLKENNAKKNRKRVVLIKLFISLLFVGFSVWAIIFTLSDANIDLPDLLSCESTPTATPPPAPTISPYEPIGFCSIPPDDSILPPCDYEIVALDSSTKISSKLFDTYKYAGIIADLNRDSKGKNASFIIGEVITIPKKDADRTVEYLNDHLGYEICSDGEIYPSNPCLYISKGESYFILANMFYEDETYKDDIREANDIQYLPPKDVEPMDLKAGVIVVIPSWP